MLPIIGIAGSILSAITGTLGASSTASSIAGALLGSSGESVAGRVVDAAKAFFGVTDASQIPLLIQQDKSKAELLLKQIDQETEMYRIQVDDTKSARTRDIEIRKLSNGANIRANIMLGMAFTCLIVILISVIFYRKDIPDGVLALMNMCAGAILAMLTQAFNFEFGSSRSSGEKSEQLASMFAGMKLK